MSVVGALEVGVSVPSLLTVTCVVLTAAVVLTASVAGLVAGGKREALHDGHNNKSQIEFLTVRLFTFFGQGPVGRPSHLGMTIQMLSRNNFVTIDRR